MQFIMKNNKKFNIELFYTNIYTNKWRHVAISLASPSLQFSLSA